ncbi:hypothetical protein HK405_008306 [Cladochytrium tenue]|nr:hypothetical protein HK405_008306 [Cladochytrium tenue]
MRARASDFKRLAGLVGPLQALWAARLQRDAAAATSRRNMAGQLRKFEYGSADAESVEFYRPGGFHSTHLGDLLHGRNRIMRKLGFEQSSTVWLARDVEKDRYVCVKICTAAADAADEIGFYQAITASAHPGRVYVQRLIDHFVHRGPNGRHTCLVFEPLGRNMNTFAESHAGRPITTVFARELCRQLVLALDCIHSVGLAHRDIHPGDALFSLSHDLDSKSEEEVNSDVNLEIPSVDDDDNNGDDDDDYDTNRLPFTICPVRRLDRQPLTKHEPSYICDPCPLPDGATGSLPPVAFSACLSDFGAATSALASKPGDPPTYPLGLRSPQVILQIHPFSYQAADVWALGLTLWELVVREPLLSVWRYDEPELTDDSHLESAVGRLGPVPDAVRKAWPRADSWVDAEGRLLNPTENNGGYWYGDVEQALESGKPSDMTDRETELFLNFVTRMLAWEEETRASAKELLEHAWLKDCIT